MADKLKKLEEKRWIFAVILIIIMALQLTRIIYTFNQREGYHSDETWSYGFANSYYEPYIFQDVDENRTNYYKWEDGSVFHDYVTVQKGERFAYGSVYYNQKNDMSPPLHSMVLHTICSFFPDSFSWWYSFSINIVSFIICQIILYFLGRDLLKSKWLGLLTVLFYGFTTGALNTYIYMRMYAMLTMFAVLLAYLHLRLYNKNFEHIKKELILILLTVFLGCFTHYYFFVLAFFFAACTCIYLMIKGRWKKFAFYACSMLSGVGITFAVYPYAWKQLTGGTSNYAQHLSYWFKYKFCLMVFSDSISGWNTFYSFSIFLIILLGVAVILSPVLILLRKSEGMKKVTNGFKNFFKHPLNRLNTFFKTLFKNTDAFTLTLFVSVFATIGIIAMVSSIGGMNVLLDRYMFFLMPLFCLWILSFTNHLLIKFGAKKRSAAVVLILVAAVILGFNNYNNRTSPCNYIFQKGNDGQGIEDVSKDSNILVCTSNNWHLTCYASRIGDCSKFCAIDDEYLTSYPSDMFDNIDKSKKTYFIIPDTYLYNGDKYSVYSSYYDKSADLTAGMLKFSIDDIVEYYEKFDSIKDLKYLYNENSFLGNCYVYEIIFK